MIKVALRLHLEARLAIGEPIPPEVGSERVRVAVSAGPLPSLTAAQVLAGLRGTLRQILRDTGLTVDEIAGR